ncbi:hypothetical protein YC2023_070196 [Brassica napus]
MVVQLGTSQQAMMDMSGPHALPSTLGTVRAKLSLSTHRPLSAWIGQPRTVPHQIRPVGRASVLPTYHPHMGYKHLLLSSTYNHWFKDLYKHNTYKSSNRLCVSHESLVPIEYVIAALKNFSFSKKLSLFCTSEQRNFRRSSIPSMLQYISYKHTTRRYGEISNRQEECDVPCEESVENKKTKEST